MSILRVTSFALAGLAAAGWLLVSTTPGIVAIADAESPNQGRLSDTRTSMMSRDQKIANAMSAGPASVAERATILDWPAKPGDQPTTLRPGTNGWSCLPDDPSTEGNDPMCLDATWMQWVQAYLTKTAPKLSSVGIAYMMAPGGSWGSNTDPFATTRMADNQWHLHPPHMMIVVPDLKSLDGLPTDPGNGGPYVMFKGTPYAHIMAPVTAMGHDMMKMDTMK
jgi:hypothetical protein